MPKAQTNFGMYLLCLINQLSSLEIADIEDLKEWVQVVKKEIDSMEIVRKGNN